MSDEYVFPQDIRENEDEWAYRKGGITVRDLFAMLFCITYQNNPKDAYKYADEFLKVRNEQSGKDKDRSGNKESS